MAINQTYHKVPVQKISHDAVSQKQFINDPYFSLTDDPKVYLTRLINSQLEALLDDSCLKGIYGGIIDGMECNLYSIDHNLHTFRIQKGMCILDSTLVEFGSYFDVTAVVTPEDLINGFSAVAILSEFRFINDATIDNPVQFRSVLYNPFTREVKESADWIDEEHTMVFCTAELRNSAVFQEPFYLFESINYNLHEFSKPYKFEFNTLESVDVTVSNSFNINHCVLFDVDGVIKTVPMAFRTITTNALLELINGTNLLSTTFNLNNLVTQVFRGLDDQNLFVFSMPYDARQTYRKQNENLTFSFADVADTY